MSLAPSSSLASARISPFCHICRSQPRGKARSLVVMAAADGKLKVVVTGAGGRTGGLVMKKLLEKKDQFEAVGILRNEKAAQQLREGGATVFVGDLLNSNGPALLEEAFQGADRLVIATSAVPKIKPLSLIPVILAKLFKKEGARPQFTFKENQTPEQVDWEGQKLQIDAAKKAGIKKCVLVGSMGGTDRNNFLNTIGDGNILVWKRRAELYLMNSGLDYTIIHPGGLIDDPGSERELVIDVNDALLKGSYRAIPRADVASLAVACLTLGPKRSIDVVSKRPGEGQVTTDFAALLAGMSQNCGYDDMIDDPVLLKETKEKAASA